MRKCARITKYLRWVGSKVCDFPIYEGFLNLTTFLEESEVKVLDAQRFLSLDVALKATPIRWWDAHKQSMSEWPQC